MKKSDRTYNKHPRYLDLFAGAGGLSEGFNRVGFRPVAHVELASSACYTLKTRAAMQWLYKRGKKDTYIRYLRGEISREELYRNIPQNKLSSVINAEIGHNQLASIFSKIDELAGQKSIDLIIGGPPCQAYSLIGRSRDANKMKGDKRNYLYQYYSMFLVRYRPEYFVFENVTGLMSAKDEKGNKYFDAMKESFHNAGYEIETKLLSSEEFGVLQNRKRIIIIGKKTRNSFTFPELTKWMPEVQVNEIFKDLPSIQAGSGSITPCKPIAYNGKYLYTSKIKNDSTPITWHVSRPNTEQDLEIYRIAVEYWNNNRKRLSYNDLPKRLKTHNNNSSFTDRFKVVEGDMKYAHTVVAHISKDGHYYIHPDIRQNRSLTPREAARLQTFPDDYYFESTNGLPSRTAAFAQIGNAVPVLMAEKIAQGLLSIW
ncbi:MAG: DNA cytosine methyltransferase [Treponema sp.]|nr:DNA cytosine methyltransferase [Treponema sp.]